MARNKNIPNPYDFSSISPLISSMVGLPIFENRVGGTGGFTGYHLCATTASTSATVSFSTATQTQPPTASGDAYCVTAIMQGTEEESLISNIVYSSTTAILSWNAVEGATRYNIYHMVNAIWGYQASTGAGVTSYQLTTATPSFEKGPPTLVNYFTGADSFPGCAAFHQQRIIYARTNNNPQTLFLSTIGNFESFNASTPAQDDDGLAATIASTQVNEIKFILSFTKGAFVFTSGGEWLLQGGGGAESAITPTSISVQKQSDWGCADVRPMILGLSGIFVDRSGRRVRDLMFQIQFDSYSTNELSIMAQHLFESGTIKRWCYQQYPQPIVWMVTSDGRLISLCYSLDRTQQIIAWARHDTTNGTFEDIVKVPSTWSTADKEDIYALIKRTINGSDVRYIERVMKKDNTETLYKNGGYVDCAYSYNGTPVTTISSGISHLEGQVVSVLCDGRVETHTVTGGSVTLNAPASYIILGLKYKWQLKPMEFVAQLPDGVSTDRTKQAASLWVNIYKTRSVYASYDETDTSPEPIALQSAVDAGGAQDVDTGERQVVLKKNPNLRDGTICLSSDDPCPATILNVISRVTYGQL